MILKNAEFLDIFILMSILNFMHKKSFITSRPGKERKSIS